MEEFYKDILKFGCLKGFRHFKLYLRGREELVVTVKIVTSAEQHSPVKQPVINNITKASKPLPPASPAGRGDLPGDPGEMVFLVGAYARYNWPYVWLRSNHGVATTDKDLPLDLKTTQSWSTRGSGHRVWHIVEELIALNVQPQPANPFEVDMTEILEIPQFERMVMAGALSGFLRELLLQDLAQPKLVAKDLEQLLRLHISDLSQISKAS